MLNIKEVMVFDKDAVQMRQELAQILQSITGCSGNASFQESDMQQEKSTFVVAYMEGIPVGCGAIHPISDTTAELKRMYAKQRGIGA